MAQVEIPGTGERLEVPDDWSAEQVARKVREFQATRAQQAQAPSAGNEFNRMVSGMDYPVSSPGVPTGDPSLKEMPAPVDVGGPLMSTSGRTDYDRSQTDDWGPWVDKMIKSGARGTARGLAQGADWAVNNVQGLYRLGQETAGVDPKNYPTLGDQPVTDFVERNVIPQPRGSQYEDVASKAETVGPLLLTGGRSLLKEGVKTLGKEAANLPYDALRMTRDVGLGYAGGEAGGFIGEQADRALGGKGDIGRAFGTAFGGMSAPIAVSEGGRYLLRKAFTDKNTAGYLQTIEDINAQLPDYAPKIPATLGLVGTKNAGLLEDILGRGILSGDPSVQARRKQYEGMEAGVQEAAARTRGTNATPIPSTEKITPETIGNKVSDMAVKTEAEANRKIDLIQTRLRNRVGAESPVDPSAIERELRAIIDTPAKGSKSQARARVLLNEFRADYPPKYTTIQTPSGPKQVPLPTTTQPYFGKVQATRSEIGSTIDPATSKPIQGAEKKLAVKGASEAMKETAVRQGVSPGEYDRAQSQTRQFARDREAAEKISKGGNEGKEPLYEKEAFNRLFSGAKKGGVRNLDAYERHATDDIAHILADKLELETRGDVNAGLPAPVPETFDLGGVSRNWSTRSDEYKDVMSQNNPAVRKLLDDVAHLATKEEVRPGRRTVPGKTGSTIGATQQIFSPSVLGGITAGKLGALALPILSAGGSNVLGKLITNPKYVTDLVKNAPPSLSNLLSKAVAGLASSGVLLGRDEAARKEKEEQQRLFQKKYGDKREPTDIGTIRPPKKGK